MKAILLGCLAVLLLAGCDRNPVEEFGEQMMVSYERASETADEATLQALRRSIRSYRALNGRYPESLEELQAAVGAGVDLEAYAYDPETGSLNPR